MNFQKEYDKLISQARSENRHKIKGGTYYEAHHIIPRCLGGDGKVTDWRSHPNIILLTAKEHFYAHYFLTKIYPSSGKLFHAFWAMCTRSNSFQDRDYLQIEEFANIYQQAKEEYSAIIGNRYRGKKLSPEHRANMSVAKKGKKLGPMSEETKAKLREIKKGKSFPKEGAAKALLVNRIPVVQIDIQSGNTKEWPSASDAARALGIYPGSITTCIKGKQKTAGGFIWKYKN